MDALEEADIINNHPIKDGLVYFRHQFESSRARLGFLGSFRAVEDILSTESASEDLVLDLIGALQTLPTARVLHVEIWNAVFDLIARTIPKQATTPTAFEKATFDTLLRSSSASQWGIK
ncbi:hypothetical protein BKA61DRAFT_681413 [Leptodontidium sp. MPI-SDFR-AT-0119]|nr:hypothetical protein BKA61DRAFT_681413 [Leptodontidium sp. MPI-SDFR-AT-0119]